MSKLIAKCFPLAASIMVVLFAALALAQSTYVITGKVTDVDGKPIEGATIRFERLDIKWSATVKTSRRGDYTHAGIPVGGKYRLVLELGGKELDSRPEVRPRLGEPLTVNFDLAEKKKGDDAARLAQQTGVLTPEQARALTPGQREEIERTLEAQAEQIKARKELNDAFNAGVEAAKAGQHQAAVDAFTRASEIDPKQDAVWSRLADSYLALGLTKSGVEQEAAFLKVGESYQKAMDLKPTEAAYINNYGQSLIKMKKVPEAMAAFEKAAQMDPANAALFYYNLGATLMNTGQMDAAGEAFKKSIGADPKYAPSQYQYGIYLVGKAQIGADGKIQPPAGTREAFQTYLELDPSGPFAQAAKDMLATFDQAIQTEFKTPDAKKQQQQKKK